MTAREARRIAVAAQGLAGTRQRGGVAAMLQRLRAVQLDTISVLARSHELVAYARLGAIKRTAIEEAYWGGSCFEYWAHAACVVPAADWPNYGWRRERTRERGRRWHWLEDAAHTIPGILDRLRAEGPLTANALGGAKKGGVWWDWSETKIAVEWLLDIGEVVCTERRGFQRVYDLPERALPSDVLGAVVDPVSQKRELLAKAALALGVASASDLSAYTGVPSAEVVRLVGESDLVPVAVEGWSKRAWATPLALAGPPPPPRRAPTMLSPFDSLIWERDRVSRLFGFEYRLEAYTPKPKRIYGYCTLPVLSGGELIARVDPGREGRTFVGKGVHLEPSVLAKPAAAAAAIEAVARSMWSAAAWVGGDDVQVERVTPDDIRPAMLTAVVAVRP